MIVGHRGGPSRRVCSCTTSIFYISAEKPLVLYLTYSIWS